MELFSFDEFSEISRRLAKGVYWQNILSLSKDINGIKIFQNDRDFTFYQMRFINDLSFYSSLFYDIASNEVSDRVLENTIYEDAYYYYRNEKRLAKTKRANQFQDSQHGTVVKKINEQREEIVNKNVWSFTKTKKT